METNIRYRGDPECSKGASGLQEFPITLPYVHVLVIVWITVYIVLHAVK